MKISIIGLGYVGSVSLLCLSKLGHQVIGFDTNAKKHERLRQGRLPILEQGLKKEFEKLDKTSIKAAENLEEAILESEIVLVTVSAPIKKDRTVNLDFIENTCAQIAAVLRKRKSPSTIVVRSTVPPGTCESLVAKIESVSGKKNGHGFFFVFNPEFIREGSAIEDYLNPPYTIVGASKPSHSKKLLFAIRKIPGEKIITKMALAELLKYSSNSFHALKVVFANEIGALSQSLGVDANELMRIFSLDKKLNISSYYLSPGFAFGGSCLPKDLKALNQIAQTNKINLPLMRNIEKSNELMTKKALALIKKFRVKKIGFLGITFKAETSDLRGSPALEIMAKLSKNYSIFFFDPNITALELETVNGEISASTIARLSQYRVDSIKSLIKNSEIIVVATREKAFIAPLNKEKKKPIVDLANIPILNDRKNYVGLNW